MATGLEGLCAQIPEQVLRAAWFPGATLCGFVATPETEATGAGAGLKPSGGEDGAGAPSADGPWRAHPAAVTARDGE